MFVASGTTDGEGLWDATFTSGGADIICLQETMMSQVDQHFWTVLRWGTSGAAIRIDVT